MTFEEAVEESIRKFYEGMNFENYEAAVGKPMKYTKKYFDDQESDLVKEVDEDDEDDA